MAEFITKCPHCNAELRAQNEWIGIEVECPECQKTFTVSAPDTDEKKSTPPPFQGAAAQPTPPPFQGAAAQPTPPPFQGTAPQSSTPPPFQGAKTGPNTYNAFVKEKLTSCVDAMFQGRKTSPSVCNTYVRDKLMLYANAMDVAVFLFIVLCPVVFSTDAADAGKMAQLKSFILYILAAVTIGCFWAAVGLEVYLIWETARAIPEKRRRQHPAASALLMLIPGWCFIWNFFTLPKIAAELNEEILRTGKMGPKNLYPTAVAHCVFTLFMILLAAVSSTFIEVSGSSAGTAGSIAGLAIIMFCALAVQHQTFAGFAKAVAVIKSEELE